MKTINMAEPFFTYEEKERVKQEVSKILDNSLSMGPNVIEFQREFSKKMKINHSIAMNSCTSALEAAIQYFDVSGKEVIVPCQSFIATAMAVILSGGKPVFAEIKKETMCLDMEDIKKKINSNTKGIIVVHMAGNISPDLYDLYNFCKCNNLFLIEDAAHTPGSKLIDKYAGTIGDVGCFSFYPSKIITCGEGGMLTTSNDEIAKFAKSYQNRGRDMSVDEEIYTNPGRNVRMTEISAFLGRIQLANLDKYLENRRRIASIYINALNDHDEIFLVAPKNLHQSSFWKFPIILNDRFNRDKILMELNNKGIKADAAYKPPLHLQPVIKRILNINDNHLPFSEKILRQHICLPCHQRMSNDDANYVVDTLLETLVNI